MTYTGTSPVKTADCGDKGRVPNLLTVLKIYSLCHVYYRFSTLAVNSEHGQGREQVQLHLTDIQGVQKVPDRSNIS